MNHKWAALALVAIWITYGVMEARWNGSANVQTGTTDIQISGQSSNGLWIWGTSGDNPPSIVDCPGIGLQSHCVDLSHAEDNN